MATPNPISQTAMNDYLKLEYEQCLSLLTFYDERFISLVKWAAALSGGIPTLLVSIYALEGMTAPHFWMVAALVAIPATFGLIAIFTVLIPVRLYFVLVARQVNSIRDYFLRNNAPNDFINKLYRTANEPKAFNKSSSHRWSIAFVAAQIGAVAGLGAAASTATRVQSGDWNLWAVVVIAVLLATAIAILAYNKAVAYLENKGDRNPPGTRAP